jgi:PAS domain S-box-containing protein
MPIDLRVLLVEDDENDTLLLLRELKKGGFKPFSKRVQTAGELKALLDEDHWDIAVADHILPEFSGLEALAIISKHPEDVPCILVSGKVGEEYAVEAMRLGAVDYISKERLSRLAPAVRRELKDAEIRRRQAENERRLQESQEQYRHVVEGAVEGIVVAQDELFVFVNPAFAEMLGRSVEEVVGNPIDEYGFAEDRAQGVQYYRDRMDGRPGPEHYEMRLVDARGKPVWIQFATSVIEWKGRPASLSFVSDISSQKELQEELRRANEELRSDREELRRKNIALTEILTQIENEKKEIKRRLLSNVEHAIFPTVRRIEASAVSHQLSDLRMLKDDLKRIVSPFIDNLIQKMDQLTPREIDVCRLIKTGATSKEIARSLNLAPGTISKYREMIRNKLGLSHKDVNLANYLQSLGGEVPRSKKKRRAKRSRRRN